MTHYHFLAPVSRNWCRKQVPDVWCQKPWHILAANDIGRHNNDGFRLSKFYIEIHFFVLFGVRCHMTVLWVKKRFHHSTSSFTFVYKQTSCAVICSDWPISFSASFRHEIEHALTGAGFWHQKNMTDWPVSGTSRPVPKTGTWNWPVCHHYNDKVQWMRLPPVQWRVYLCISTANQQIP